jgi:uncharacterized membrane protein YjgN (DUF898 family)
MTELLVIYLSIGCLASVALGTALALKYRSHVFAPAAEIRGAREVAIGQDALTLFVLCALTVVAWLPLGLAYAWIRVRKLTSRQRSRDNTLTPTL